MKNPPIPHSWPLSDWPASVYPNDSRKARWLVRSNRDELTHAGALARVGRQLVVIGGPYARWLQRKSAAVTGYECAANRETETT